MTYSKEQQKANRKKWVEALRSGDYVQGEGQLKTVVDGVAAHCCLGVACELFADNYHGTDKNLDDYYGVMEAVGLRSPDGFYSVDGLVVLNDNGTFFSEIADIIESEPKGLFVD